MKKVQDKSKSTDLLINFVVDKSASMSSYVQPTIDGFNRLVESEEEAGIGATYVTLTLFDSFVNPRYVGVHSSQVAPLGSYENPYYPSGMTALYDAVGTSIKGVEGWLTANPWFKGRVLTVILTDGAENSSRKFDLAKVNRAIDRKQRAGWTFQFLGQGEAGWREGSNFHVIPQANRAFVRNDAAHIEHTYDSFAASNVALRTVGAWNYSNQG